MSQFAYYIHLWNDWVVFPGILIASLILHSRRRKRSTLLLAVGMCLLILGKVGDSLGPEYILHPFRLVALSIYVIGFLSAVIGFGWFLLKNLHDNKKESISGLEGVSPDQARSK